MDTSSYIQELLIIDRETMKKNVGSIDRTLRIILGIVIIALGIYFQSWWGIIGLVPLATAFMNWCPAYLPFGLSTCKTKSTGK